MQTVILNDGHVPTSSLVEILTLPGIDLPLGYKFSGVRNGPTALVSAYSGTVEAIFDRLARLPTLPWMRGSIYLLTLEAMDNADARVLKAAMADITFDESILLPFVGPADPDADKAVCQGYWTTLRLCARLGIIEGRGVNDYAGPDDAAPHASDSLN